MKTSWVLSLLAIVLAAPSWSQDNDGGYVDRPHSESESWVNKDHGTTRENVPAETEKSVQTAPIVIKGRDGKNGKNGRNGRTTVRILREFRVIPAKPRVPGYFVEDYRDLRRFTYGLGGFITRSEKRTSQRIDGLSAKVDGLSKKVDQLLDPTVDVRPGTYPHTQSMSFNGDGATIIPDPNMAVAPWAAARVVQQEGDTQPTTSEDEVRDIFFRLGNEPVEGVVVTFYDKTTETEWGSDTTGAKHGGVRISYGGEYLQHEFEFTFKLPAGYASDQEGQRLPLDQDQTIIEVQKEGRPATEDDQSSNQAGHLQPANPQNQGDGNTSEKSSDNPPPAKEEPKAEQKQTAPDLGAFLNGWASTIFWGLVWIGVGVVAGCMILLFIGKFLPWLFRTGKEKEWGTRSKDWTKRQTSGWWDNTRRNWAEAGQAGRDAKERRRREADAALAAYDPVKMREEAARVRVPTGTTPVDDTRRRYLDGDDGEDTPLPFMASAPPPGTEGGTA